MFTHLTAIRDAEFTSENQEMSADVIKNAYLATEEGFLSMVKRQWEISPQIASVGSCCLVGIICSGLIYIANAGDSRVVLARLEKTDKQVKAVQLSAEHNASLESVREELQLLHPEDPQIVVLKHKVWRVKGLIQVTPCSNIILLSLVRHASFSQVHLKYKSSPYVIKKKKNSLCSYRFIDSIHQYNVN